MQKVHLTNLLGVVFAILSWMVIGLLVLALVRALITGSGWMYLD
jgi:hypothetical protein